jgi:hypothetical protein
MTRTCQFPEGDPLEPSYRVCGKAIERPGGSYCEMHAAIAYPHRKERQPRLQKSPPRPRQRKSIAGGRWHSGPHKTPDRKRGSPLVDKDDC